MTGQRCAGSKEILTPLTSNGFFDPPIFVPDYGELDRFGSRGGLDSWFEQYRF